jgi:hypothetical protein
VIGETAFDVGCAYVKGELQVGAKAAEQHVPTTTVNAMAANI